MRRTLRMLVLAGLFGAIPPVVVAQECHDWDADGAAQGWQCAVAEDCADRWWGRRPGVPEACNGLDEDCDGTTDEGCDLWCDELGHVPVTRELPLAGYSHFRTADVVRTERGVLVGAGMHEEFNNRLSRLFLRAYDDEGRTWDGAYEMTGESPNQPFHDYVRLASAGDRAMAVWIDIEGFGRPVWGRVVDALGRPLGPAWNISDPKPGSPIPERDGATVLWDGDRFVVFWMDLTCGGLYMSTFSADGVPSTPISKVVTSRATGLCRGANNPVAFWVGDRYVVFFETAVTGDDIRVLEVSCDGSPLGLAREIAGEADFINAVQTRDGIALVWSEPRIQTAVYAHFALTDNTGTVLDPPGIVPLSLPENLGEDKWHAYIDWTGEMFLIAVEAVKWIGNEDHWRWLMWRVLPDGTVLDPGGFVISDHVTTRRLHDIVWSGEEIWVFGARFKPALNELGLHWERVSCSCADADGDTFDACEMADCDDTRASVNPFAPEVCRGQLDDDCDGLIDCADVEDCPASAGPPAVVDLGWDVSGLSWSAVAGAEVYDVARGLVSDARRRGDLLQAECVGPELAAPHWSDDGRRPPAGDVLWYVVRPEGVPCALGPWGVDRPREVTACF